MKKPRHLALVSFAGGSASSVAVPLEIFEFASRQALGGPSLNVSVVTLDGSTVTCDGCMTIRPDAALSDLKSVDVVLFTCMSNDVNLAISANAGILNWLRRAMSRNVLVATVCPSQAVLAHGGLLDGRTVSIHWSVINEVRRRFPRVNWAADRMLIEDDGIVSCCGAGATIDLALYLVDRLFGRDVMLACAQWFLADPPRVRQSVPPPMMNDYMVGSGNIAQVEAWLLEHFREPVHFETLAGDFGMSWRTFYRRFQEAFGDSPKVYLQKLRLNAARQLLETESLPIDQVATKVGYADAAYFRSLFKRYVGMTPSAYRERFRFRSMIEV